MTTIVYSDGVLAADSQGSSGFTKMQIAFEKIRTPAEGKRWSIFDKRILAIGVAGDAAGIHEFIDHLEKGIGFETRGKWDAWNDVIAVADDRTIFVLDSRGDRKNVTFLNIPAESKIAIGSGSEAAHAYLAIGKKPADIIKLVSKIDLGTGGDVKTWEFPETVPADVKPEEPSKTQKDLIAKAEAQIFDIAKAAVEKATAEILAKTKAEEPAAAK